MVDYKKNIIEELELLRDQTKKEAHLFLQDIDFLHYYLDRGGLSLSDVGTSEEELKVFRVLGLKWEAKTCLRHLRDTTTKIAYKCILDNLLDIVNETGLSLEEIGTNEKEVRSFRVRYLRILLELARGDSKHPGVLVGVIISVCNREKISFAEIGTDDEELKRLCRI